MTKRIVRPAVRHEPCWWADDARHDTGSAGLIAAAMGTAVVLGALLWLL
jgi:hypothetical protein